MTDPKTPTPAQSQTESVTTGRWTRRLLVLSLGLNLLIAGLAIGAFWRDGPGRGSRDFGFGPMSQAMNHEDRMALRDAFLERHPDARSDRRAMRAHFETLIAALRAEPFDEAALETAVAAITTRNAELLATGQSLMTDHLKQMSAAERAGFADRLEKGLRRMRGQ